MSKHHQNSKPNRKPFKKRGTFRPNRRNQRKPHYSNHKGRSNQIPVRTDSELFAINPNAYVPDRLKNVPNRLTNVTVEIKDSHAQFKEIESYTETDKNTGQVKKYYKTVDSLPSITDMDDVGTQKLFHVFNQILEIDDDDTNSGQVKLQILDQVCISNAGHTMWEAKETAYEKMMKIDGEISIFKWKEKLQFCLNTLKRVWNGREILTTEQKLVILKMLKIEEKLCKKHMIEIKMEKEHYVEHLDKFEEVKEFLQNTISVLTDKLLMGKESDMNNELEKGEDEVQNFMQEFGNELGGYAKSNTDDSSDSRSIRSEEYEGSYYEQVEDGSKKKGKNFKMMLKMKGRRESSDILMGRKGTEKQMQQI